MKVYDVFPSPAEGREVTLSVPDLAGNVVFMSVEETAPGGFAGIAFFGSEEERPARLTLLKDADDGSVGDLELLP
jgi:hypothetical protein